MPHPFCFEGCASRRARWPTPRHSIAYASPDPTLTPKEIVCPYLAVDRVYLRRIVFPSRIEIRKCKTKRGSRLLKTAEKLSLSTWNCRTTERLLPAQLAGNEVVYSVLLTKATLPLSREDVESHFNGELSKK